MWNRRGVDDDFFNTDLGGWGNRDPFTGNNLFKIRLGKLGIRYGFRFRKQLAKNWRIRYPTIWSK
jgi:hypothetical protein